MDEREALALLGDRLAGAGDDCAVLGDLVLTTDMLHAATDFPAGTSRYTAGWRAVGASLSDVAAMGADAVATVAVLGTPEFHETDLLDVVDGAVDVSEAVGARYVGGDLDRTAELTLATTALGRTETPVRRSGAAPGEVVCVTGTLGRSGAALRLFEAGEEDRANDLFRFNPRVAAGRALGEFATAMQDSSDGLARTVHQLAEASGCGVALESPLPLDASLESVATDEADRRELGVHVGEDFELVCTVPPEDVERAREAVPCPLSPIGRTTDGGVTLDGTALPDRGWSH